MIDRAHVLTVLFGEGNALWRPETQHEAMLLLGVLYARDADAREEIIAAILAGPPLQLLKQEGTDGLDRYIFEVLAYLESEKLPLAADGQHKLAQIKERHPEWRPSKYPGMSYWAEGGWVPRGIDVEDVESIAPEDIPNRIIAFEEKFGTSRRDLCERVGVTLARNPEWGLRALGSLEVNAHDLPLDAINPILWGIRATVVDNTISIDKKRIVALLNKVGSMMEKRQIPSMWSSLPGVLKDLVSRFELPIESWTQLGIRLASLFEAFDYKRSENGKSIEWLQRAINHPYGDLADLYLSLAQQHVNVLSREEKPLKLEPNAESFFSHMLARYNIGSRYGLCLLAQRLPWMEAVAPKFTDLLLASFDWTEEGEQPLVAWSGYFWSGTLSRYLVQNFETTYIPAALRYSEFGTEERKGLANHVSAVFWFDPDRINLLYQFARAVDSGLRLDVLRGWKQHLGNAREGNTKNFFESILFPYWDWCGQQGFFSGDDGDNERFAFWELVPRSDACFPQAYQMATHWGPTKVPDVGLLVREVVNDATMRYPTELTGLLIALLELDEHPHWLEGDWRASWDAVKHSGASNIAEFENLLARKGIA